MLHPTMIRYARAIAIELVIVAGAMSSGCSWFSAFSYEQLPVPRAASRPRATRTQIVTAGGNPASVWMVRNGKGTCYNYVLRHGHATRSYYVVFDPLGQVTRHGFANCMEADRKGWLRDETARR